MLLQALVTLLSLDVYVNGPKLTHEWGSKIALAGTVVASLSLEPIALVVAQLVWVALLLEAAIRKSQVAAEVEPAPAAPVAAEVQDDKTPPAEMLSELAKASARFNANLDPKLNADKQPWRLLDDSNGVTISQSDYPKHSFYFWKAEIEVVGTKEKIFSETFDYSNRCLPNGWDPMLKKGTILKKFDSAGDVGDESMVSLYYTTAVGPVASREMLDMASIKHTPDGGLTYVNVSIRPEMKRVLPMIPVKTIEGTRGFTHSGSGIRLDPIPGHVDASGKPNKFKYTIVSAIDLGGSLFTSIVNRATTGSMQGTLSKMRAHLDKIA